MLKYIFDTVHALIIICSRACYLNSLKNTHPHNFQAIYKKCLYCGKKFHVPLNKIKDGKGKYCSKACQIKDCSVTRVCKGCGKTFSFPRWQNKICCSLSCNAKWKKIKNKEKNYIERNCLQCGKKMEILVTRNNNNRGKFCSKKCYNEWLAQIYEHYNTSLDRIRGLKKYKNWRESILQRDRYCCVKCKTKNLLEVDHIKPFIQIVIDNNIQNTKQARECKELWDINNGQTLCRKCHAKKSKKQRREVLNCGIILKTL